MVEVLEGRGAGKNLRGANSTQTLRLRDPAVPEERHPLFRLIGKLHNRSVSWMPVSEVPWKMPEDRTEFKVQCKFEMLDNEEKCVK